jgi:Domain of unknown function (DUF4419)
MTTLRHTFDIPKVTTKSPELATASSETFIKEVVGQSNLKSFHFQSRTSGITLVKSYMRDHVDSKPLNTVSKFVLALHEAFDRHLPFSISPEVIMTIVSQEVAQYVKNNNKVPSIANLFTTDPENKQFINVEVDDFAYGSPSNNWLGGISQFKSKLRERVPSNVLELMTPTLSTATMESEVTHLVSFMDAASKYYDYGMSTCCGIPSFRIEGTPDDWDALIKTTTSIGGLLPELTSYFAGLVPVLAKIRDTLDGNAVDHDFWASIYKEGGESGGPYSTGWFNNFYAHTYTTNYKTHEAFTVLKSKPGVFEFDLVDGSSWEEVEETRYEPDLATREWNKITEMGGRFTNYKSHSSVRSFVVGPKLNEFPSNLSVVPFKWNYQGSEIPMSLVAGVSSVELDNGFITPKLGVTVIEMVPSEEKAK